mmetsp:Transcript_11238/g.28145  ORF Transcript_11238/g.28145 Transcript_11238/m.28145 type:complete len:270 (+) Transcript_11238:500-1309(+)
MPAPSTSHTPPCPMFHRPSRHDARKPTARKSGGATARRAAAPASVARRAPATAMLTPRKPRPACLRRSRSSASMLTSCAAATSRRRARSSASGTPAASTGCWKTPHAIRRPLPEGKRVENMSATGSKPAGASSVELAPGVAAVLASGPGGGGVLAAEGVPLVSTRVGTTTPTISLERARDTTSLETSLELASISLSLPERAAARVSSLPPRCWPATKTLGTVRCCVSASSAACTASPSSRRSSSTTVYGRPIESSSSLHCVQYGHHVFE